MREVSPWMAAMGFDKKYELLIFDWDGTLSDSAGHIVSTTQHAIRDMGLPPREDREIAELIGLGLMDALGRLYPEHDPHEVRNLLFRHRERSKASAFAAPLFEGALAALGRLGTAGYRLAVATGKPRAGLDSAFGDHPAIAPLFELTRCADESADKPNPLMLEQILAATGVAPERALMIGDTEYDVAMAAALGMPALGVACGVHEPGRLLRAGAKAVVDSVRHLPDWLHR